MRVIRAFAEIENAILDGLTNVGAPPIDGRVQRGVDRVGEERGDEFVVVVNVLEEIPLHRDVVRADETDARRRQVGILGQ